MSCSGNNKQACGGPDRINIYEFIRKPMATSSSSSSPTPSSTPTPTPTQASAFASISQSPSNSDALDSHSSTVASSEYSSSATTTASILMDLVSSDTSTPTATPKVGWFYEGCYVDGPGPRTLPNGQGVQGGMTNQKCRDVCQGLGYVLAGTEYAGECQSLFPSYYDC